MCHVLKCNFLNTYMDISSTCRVKNLNKISFSVPFFVSLKAYNSRGSGPASDPVTATTLEDSPSLPPENVQCSVLSAQSIHISWEPPLVKGRNGIIQGYKATYHSVEEWLGTSNKLPVHPTCLLYGLFSDSEDVQTKVITQLRTTIMGLRKYTNYSITVLAYTISGDGVRSEPVFCHTEEDGET